MVILKVRMHCTYQLEAEVARCRDLRREKSRRFINEARSEIVKLWDSCYMTPEERSTFVHLTSGQWPKTYCIACLKWHATLKRVARLGDREKLFFMKFSSINLILFLSQLNSK